MCVTGFRFSHMTLAQQGRHMSLKIRRTWNLLMQVFRSQEVLENYLNVFNIKVFNVQQQYHVDLI